MVEIALDMALVALQMRLQIGRVAGQRGRAVTHAVRLDVRLGYHIETVAVAELIPVGIIRIVAGSHRIDIELLHQLDILLHPLIREHIASVGIQFVAVDALDQDAFAVDQQVRTFDLHLAETGVEMQRLQTFLAFIQADVEPVEIGIFRAPLVRILHEKATDDERADGIHRIGDFLALGIVEAHFHAGLPVIGDRGIDRQRSVTIGRVQVGRDRYIVDMLQGACINIIVPRQAGETEEILVFEIGAVAPAEDLEGDQVAFARLQEFRQVEFALQLAVFAVTYEFSVDPQIDAGSDRAEVNDHLLSFPFGRNLDVFPVGADVVVFGRRDGRRILVPAAPGITGIDIDRIAIAVELPQAGDVHPAPGFFDIVGPPEIDGALVRAPHPVEMPFPAQRNDLGLIGPERAVHRKTVDGIDVGILPFGESLGPARSGGQQKQAYGKKQFSHKHGICIQN